MSKENNKEMTVEERLKALYQLQVLVSEIDRIRNVRGELPLEVEDLADELEGHHTRIKKYKEEIETLNGYIKDSRARIASAEELYDKFKELLDDVSNDREYEAINKELENQSLDIQLYEKNIREDKQRIAQIEEAIDEIQLELNETQILYDAKSGEQDEIIAETEEDEKKLHDQALEVEKLIDKRLLKAFKRIRKASHNGLAVAVIDDETCLGCYNKLPPQTVLDVYAHRKIIPCEYCGRVLVDPDLASEVDGVSTDNESDE